MSVVSGFLPAAHTFLHNKNALILRPSWPFKLSVPRGPQMATKGSVLLLVSPQRGLRIWGQGLRPVGSGDEIYSGPLHTLCIAFEETEAQRGQEIHSRWQSRWWRWKWVSLLAWHLVLSPLSLYCGSSDWHTWVGLHFTPLNTKLPLLLFLSLLVPTFLCVSSLPLLLSALASLLFSPLSLPFPSFLPPFLPLFLFFPPPPPLPQQEDRELLSHTKLCVLRRLGRGHWNSSRRRPELSAPCHRLTVCIPSDSLLWPSSWIDSPPIFF